MIGATRSVGRRARDGALGGALSGRGNADLPQENAGLPTRVAYSTRSRANAAADDFLAAPCRALELCVIVLCVCCVCGVCTIDFTLFMIKCKEGIPRRRIPYACVFSYY